MSTASSQPLLHQVFDHLVLPAKLPALPNDDPDSLNWDLTERLLKACQQIHIPELDDTRNHVEASLLLTQHLYRTPISQETLVAVLEKIAQDKDPGWLVIHVVKQNAALIIHKSNDTADVVFEAFEASAAAPAVLGSDYALQWSFPGRSVAIPESDFSNVSFQHGLADFLEQASEVAFDQFATRARKGKELLVESRDTPSPALITEMLMSFLEATGRGFPVHAVVKRVRDDVVLGTAESPWRRSPFWLAVRVFVQRILVHSCDNHTQKARLYFKFIMCITFAHLLSDIHTRLDPDKVLMLRAKLCRRLAKLQTHVLESSEALQKLYSRPLLKMKPFFESILAQVRLTTNTFWQAQKKKMTRLVPQLPIRAPSSDLYLNLSNSGIKLREILASIKQETLQRPSITGTPLFAEGTMSQLNQFATRHSKLVASAEKAASVLATLSLELEFECASISKAILDYMDAVGSSYSGDAILTSRYLLNLFELWVAMDTSAVSICPLLRDYHPVFVPEALDMLCFVGQKELQRVRLVQHYLHSRIKLAAEAPKTIFSHPGYYSSFPVSFLRNGHDSSELHSLMTRIEDASARAVLSKKSELRELMAQYDQLSAEARIGTCCCTRKADGSLDVRGCKRCWKARCRRRLRIKAHEAFLPRDEMHRAGILLELQLPRYLAAYRNATWRLRMLGKETITEKKAITLLADFTPLRQFQGPVESGVLTLASRTKSFLQTHYRELKLPTSESEVLLPFGAELTYYDKHHNIWVDECSDVPWYHHLMGSWLPPGIADPFADALLYLDGKDRPSSYEVAANQNTRPRDMSCHEFTAYQTAISSKYKRWIVLALELGSVNLNLSSASTRKLFARLALQSGPAHVNSESDVLGLVHSIFQDITFCKRLEHQIHLRLDALDSGRSDLDCMHILMTLSLRMHYLCSETFRQNTAKLLCKVRELLSSWITKLRLEVKCAQNGEAARRAASRACWASMLCRQTFQVFMMSEFAPDFGHQDALHFFRASMAFSENLIVDLKDISPDLKELLGQDMSWVYTARNEINQWMLQHGSALEAAINETWTSSGSSSCRSFSSWEFLGGDGWVKSTTTVATALTIRQTVHYHLFQGHFLVDGKPLGKLPLEIRENQDILELFPGQHLLTRPSCVIGMEYHIVNNAHNHEIHVGFRQGKVIIRAMDRGSLLEYVPRECFRNGTTSDIPSGLIDGCVHWIDLVKGQLEIRRKPNIWKSKASNWILNVESRTATRRRDDRGGTRLVEPQSQIGKLIMQIFRDFEDPGNLTIYQPMSKKGRLSVEIKRLEMNFFVNSNGFLMSTQLSSEIDPNQDIGTLHGLESKLILRDTHNHSRRSVIVPIGTVSWNRNGPHVSVRVKNDGSYALFTVDTLLGRLTCAPEPTLFYLMALMHALTSFPLPDELTKRTGTEEACRCLTAAQSQPWKPLNNLPKMMLDAMMKLSPKRSFYPPEQRNYQTVTWDSNLTSTIQHEQLAIYAGDILRQSQLLDIPHDAIGDKEIVETDYPDMTCLALRGILRRQVYERIGTPIELETALQAGIDKVYSSRGLDPRSKGSMQVYRLIRQIRERAEVLPQLPALTPMVRKWRTVDGFNDHFSTLEIGRNLDAEASEAFCPLICGLRNSTVASDYMKQLSLAVFAFGDKAKAEIIDWLVALAKSQRLRDVKPPNVQRFTDFNLDQTFDQSRVYSLIIYSHDRDQVDALKDSGGQGRKRQTSRYSPDSYDANIEKEATEMALWLDKKWPHIPLTQSQINEACDELQLRYLSPNKVWPHLGPELEKLSQNRLLSNYLETLEDTAKELRGSCKAASQMALQTMKPIPTAINAESTISSSVYLIPPLQNLVRKSQSRVEREPRGSQASDVPDTKALLPGPQTNKSQKTAGIFSKELCTLVKIVEPLKTSQNVMQMQYGKDLEDSIAAMAEHLEQPQVSEPPMAKYQRRFQMEEAERDLQQDLRKRLRVFREMLSGQEPSYIWLECGQLWPCDSLTAVLEQLRVENYKHLSPQMKRSLIDIGLLVTKIQHVRRMQDAERDEDERKLLEESKSTGHSNWAPRDFPEWLLLEIENNILIRPVQVEVALAIISPGSNRNSVLQMNMGTGKTSVVLPMAALALADNTRLCRVIVPKSLLLQTAQVIQSRIGGLIGRRVSHIPFTRRSPSDMSTLSRYWDIHKQMKESKGIMICLPAHILSFKLSGLQRLADGQDLEGKRMVEIQHWLDDTCRDVIDESDLTLSVSTQLIYPSGDLTVLDGHPYRWLVVEELLSLVERHAPTLQKTFDGKIVVVQRRFGYPIIHFLTKETEDALNELLIEDVCNGRLPQLQMKDPSSVVARSLVKQILSGGEAPLSLWQKATQYLKNEDLGAKMLHLLRGLIGQGIILVCLKKKWNIQYGLHPERQPIAVPFEAKGVPAPAAEYGHPDTALLLTCLAFYQQGLSKEQIKQGLRGIMQSDDVAIHYDRWTSSCTSLPHAFRYWNAVDPENDSQVEALWGYLRFDRTVINHHMNKYVFPRYAKQFPVKLQASGWDIPLLQPDEGGQEQRGGRTTGFSGTNDNKRMLPRSIQQDDLPQLLLTNAEVLCHLLESRNQNCYLASNLGVRFDEFRTLKFLQQNNIRVLIDAGAHILEMENRDVAKKWLGIDNEAQGAVYFAESGQIMVISRFQTSPMPLLASPFANDLKDCVVYIDEGHTRGTDLKLPAEARGVVTLGLGQTKDHTVQAAMRLRQLGTTQSVAFLAPPEVYRSIMDVRDAYTQEGASLAGAASQFGVLTSADVVRWLLDQSCKANQQMMGLHFSQCQDFCRRTDALWKYRDFATNRQSLKPVLEVIRQKEQQTLERMYGPAPQTPAARPAGLSELASAQLVGFSRDVANMAQHGQQSWSRSRYQCSSALMEVEQEREVEFEVEQMREKQSSTKHVALSFPGLAPVIKSFIKTGQLDVEATRSSVSPFVHAFEYVGRTRIGSRFGVKATTSRLFVSGEFCRTVSQVGKMKKSEIVRPVSWILWSRSTETGLVIIPEEAEAVIPKLRNISPPVVWLLGTSAPVTKSMRSFNELGYMSVPAWPEGGGVLPSWLGVEVGVLSGRFYFEFAEYMPIMRWLGILPVEVDAKKSTGLEIQEPLQFLQEWIAFRRQTEDIQHTPMGFICRQKRLHEGHFFFLSREESMGRPEYE